MKESVFAFLLTGPRVWTSTHACHPRTQGSRCKVTCWNKVAFLLLPLLPLSSSSVVLGVPFKHLHSSSSSSPSLHWRKGARHVTLRNRCVYLRINHEHKPAFALFTSFLFSVNSSHFPCAGWARGLSSLSAFPLSCWRGRSSIQLTVRSGASRCSQKCLFAIAGIFFLPPLLCCHHWDSPDLVASQPINTPMNIRCRGDRP